MGGSRYSAVGGPGFSDPGMRPLDPPSRSLNSQRRHAPGQGRCVCDAERGAPEPAQWIGGGGSIGLKEQRRR